MSKVDVIFSINTGRSGSTYVASLMQGFDQLSCFHEPDPSFCGLPMQEYQLGNTKAFDSRMGEKTAKIETVLKSGSAYFESNHYFIKGFGWEILSRLEDKKVGILSIHRDPEKIVNSYHSIGTSILGRGAYRHLIHPFATLVEGNFESNKLWFWIKISVMRLITVIYNIPFFLGIWKRKKWNLFSGFQKRYLRWYFEKYQELQARFKSKHPNLVYVEIDLDTMSEEEMIGALQKGFDLGEYHPVPTVRNSKEEITQRLEKLK